MRFCVVLSPDAEDDLQKHHNAGNKILLRKIQRLLDELEDYPRFGTGKPEPLKYSKENLWSRRIDERHRMVYTIEEDQVIVLVISLWGHYGEK